MIKKILLIIVFICIIFSIYGVNQTSSPFLRFGGGANAKAVANTFVSLSYDHSSLFWNPAGLVECRGFGMNWTYDRKFITKDLGINYANMDVIIPSQYIGVFAFAFTGFHTGTINSTEISSNYEIERELTSSGSYSVLDGGITIGYATMVNRKIAVGINTKLFSELAGLGSSELLTPVAPIISADLGAKFYELFAKFDLAVVVKNLGIPYKAKVGSYKGTEWYMQPIDIGVGIARYFRILTRSLVLGIDLHIFPLAATNFSIDTLTNIGNLMTLSFGIDFQVIKHKFRYKNNYFIFSILFGYELKLNRIDAYSGIHAGVRLKILALNLELAYTPNGQMGQEMMFTIGYELLKRR